MSFKPLEQPAIRETATTIIGRSLFTGDPIFVLGNFPFTALEELREQVQQTWKAGNAGRVAYHFQLAWEQLRLLQKAPWPMFVSTIHALQEQRKGMA